MRKFFSYGPVDCEEHFCVPRRDFVEKAVSQLIGKPDKGGHYFTIWAPRQTGKTWLMREVKKEIEKKYSEKFICGFMSMQGLIFEQDEEPKEFLRRVPDLFSDTFNINTSTPKTWEELRSFFKKKKNIFKKPVILFIDEFDSLPSKVIDHLVTLFRDIYLKRDAYLLHGLALIGVRAVLGVDSERGSPFNIQRSMHVENFTFDEVRDLYNQYIDESGQKITDEVIDKLYYMTRGQPGLTCWFGELLTEKYNPEKDKEIDLETWKEVYRRSISVEWNNTVLNLIKKAKGRYLPEVLSIFEKSNIKFSLDSDWCSFLYLNGIIDYETVVNPKGEREEVCRFSNPFIQQRLYNALTYDFAGDDTPIYALRIGDDLSDVFEEGLNLKKLIDRYRDYLKRLKGKGISPFKNTPKRNDLNIYEAGGHFHLYHWLMNAVGRQCGITPEFPTGNGRVDLHIKCEENVGIIEVKSFRDMATLEQGKVQAANYAKKLGIDNVVIVVFLYGVEEEETDILKDKRELEGVKIITEPIVF